MKTALVSEGRCRLTLPHYNTGMLDITVPNVNERKRIPMRAIRAVAKRIAETFLPDKIILFGSYAHGTPKPWSDVDLLVVMDTPEGSLAQMLAISRALSPHPFGIDVIAHSTDTIDRRVAAGDVFLKDIMIRGKTLYERRESKVGRKG